MLAWSLIVNSILYVEKPGFSEVYILFHFYSTIQFEDTQTLFCEMKISYSSIPKLSISQPLKLKNIARAC